MPPDPPSSIEVGTNDRTRSTQSESAGPKDPTPVKNVVPLAALEEEDDNRNGNIAAAEEVCIHLVLCAQILLVQNLSFLTILMCFLIYVGKSLQVRNRNDAPGRSAAVAGGVSADDGSRAVNNDVSFEQSLNIKLHGF